MTPRRGISRERPSPGPGTVPSGARGWPIAATSTPEASEASGSVVVPDRLSGLLTGLAILVVLLLVDQALGKGNQVIGLTGIPAFVTAIFSGPRRTAIVGVLATAAAFAWGLREADGLAVAQLVRVGFIGASGAGAVGASALRVQRDRRLVQVSRIAELAQLAVLRDVPERVGAVDVGIRFVSATAEARVGGDFYEVLPRTGGVRIVLGDVRGKGVGAVRLASVLVGAFRAADHDAWDLGQVARSMDSAFGRIGPADEDFATALLIDVDDAGAVTILNCGHPAPLLIEPDGAVIELEPVAATLPIGLGPTGEPMTVALGPRDRVLAFTDGLIEARRGPRSFDVEATAAKMASGQLQHAVDRLRVELVRFLGGRLDDDTSLVLFQRAATD